MATVTHDRSIFTIVAENQIKRKLSRHQKERFTAVKTTVEGQVNQSKLLLCSFLGQVVIAGTHDKQPDNTPSSEYSALYVEPTPSISDEFLSRYDNETQIPISEISSRYGPVRRAIMLARIVLGTPAHHEDIWLQPPNTGGISESAIPE